MKNLLFILLALVVITSTAHAQEWTVYTAANSDLPGDTITALLVPERIADLGWDGTWAGTTTGLAARSENGSWTPFTPANSGLPHNHITALTWLFGGSDHNNQQLPEIAIGTPGGLVLANSLDEVQLLTQADGLPSDTITALHKHRLPSDPFPSSYEGEGTSVWVGTPQGLVLYTRWDDDVSAVPFVTGYVEAIEELPDGSTVWVAVTRGANGEAPGIYEFRRLSAFNSPFEEWTLEAFYAQPNVGLCLENALDLDFEGSLEQILDPPDPHGPFTRVHFENLRAPYVMYGTTPGGGTDACSEGEGGGDPLALLGRQGRMGRYDGSTWSRAGGRGSGDALRSPLPEGILTDVANFGGYVWVGSTPVEGVGGGLAYAPSGYEDGAWTVLRAGDEGVGLPSNTVLKVSVDDELGRVWAGTTAGLALYTPPLFPPLQAAPIHGAEQVPVTPLLQWVGAPSAVSYRIQVSVSPTFSAPDREWEVQANARTEFVVPANAALNGNTQYYWRIHTENGAEVSPWSEPLSFTTGEVVAVHHAVEAGGVEVDSETGAVWARGRSTLHRYDGTEWSTSDRIVDYYQDDFNQGYPTYAALTLGAGGAVWAGAGPSYNVAGPDFYTTNPGFLTRRAPEPPEYVAGTEFPPSGYPAVAAENASTVWTCRTEFSAPPEMVPGPAVLQRWSEGTVETYDEVTGCEAIAVKPGGGVWVGSGSELYHVNGAVEGPYTVPLSSEVTAVAPAPDGLVWVGTEGGGVATFDPSSGIWTSYTAADSPVLGTPVRAFAFHNEVVWIATASGLARYDGFQWHVWSRENGAFPSPVDDVAVRSDGAVWVAAGRVVTLNVPAFPVDVASAATPASFALHPVYPNPSHLGATLAFDVPTAGPITLAVYDTLGRRVATIVEGNLSAGSHRVVWEADGVASGVYVVQLTGSPGQISQKITLLR